MLEKCSGLVIPTRAGGTG